MEHIDDDGWICHHCEVLYAWARAPEGVDESEDDDWGDDE